MSSEVSGEFIQGMQDRMEVSLAKYGPIRDAYPHKVNALESLQKRIDKYIATGNTEWLMDVANFAMIEWMYPSHPRAHFRATDSHESPGRESRDQGQTSQDNEGLGDVSWKELQEFLAQRRAELAASQ